MRLYPDPQSRSALLVGLGCTKASRGCGTTGKISVVEVVAAQGTPGIYSLHVWIILPHVGA